MYSLLLLLHSWAKFDLREDGFPSSISTNDKLIWTGTGMAAINSAYMILLGRYPSHSIIDEGEIIP